MGAAFAAALDLAPVAAVLLLLLATWLGRAALTGHADGPAPDDVRGRAASGI